MDDLLRAKLALEDDLAAKLWRILKRYVRERVQVRHMGTFRALAWIGALEDALAVHYARVSLICTGRPCPAKPTLADAALSFSHMERMRQRAKEQAVLIIRGIDKLVADYDAAESRKEALQTKGWTKKLQDKAKAILGKVWSKLRGIANANTNPPAEDARMEDVRQRAGNRQLMKRWSTMRDDRVRDWHDAAEGQLRPVNDAFVVGGEQLAFPGDASMGASLRNLINCFPASTKVSGDVAAATRHWFDGELVEVTTSTGKQLAGTPNHPILTDGGWVGLGRLHEGSNVVCRVGGDFDAIGFPRSTHNVNDVQPGIEQVFDALSRFGVGMWVDRLAVNFHGDRPAHQVDVVRANGVLGFGEDSAFLQELRKLGLAGTFLDLGEGLPYRLARLLKIGGHATPAGGIGGTSDSLALSLGCSAKSEQIGFTSSARGNSCASQAPPNISAAFAKLLGNGENGIAIGKEPDNFGGCVESIVAVRRFGFSGHVYNLETLTGTYLCNGIVAHNCRCSCIWTARNHDGTFEDLGATVRARMNIDEQGRRRWTHN